MQTEERVKRVTPESIEGRVKYLREVIKKGDAKFEKLNWKDNSCGLFASLETTRLGGGCYGDVYKVCIDNNVCDYKFAVKKMEVDDIRNLNYPYSTENIEVKISKLLNELVYTGVTPHISLYMGDFTCDLDFVDYNYLMIELADGTFTNFLKTYDESDRALQCKIAIFQILYTLKVIQKRFYDFIHNDLKSCNVLYFSPDKTLKGKYYKYMLDGTNYYLPADSFRFLISDFGMSSIISKKCDNETAERVSLHLYPDIGVQTEKNHYKDAYKILGLIERLMGKERDAETIKFIQKYTAGQKSDSYGNLIHNIEPHTIEEMLDDPYFDELRGFKDRDFKEGEIVESFSDRNINPDISNIYGISDITRELKLDCADFESVITGYMYYVDYRNPKRNDENRIKCKTTSNTFKNFYNPYSMGLVDLTYMLSGKYYEFDKCYKIIGKLLRKSLEKISLKTNADIKGETNRIVSVFIDLFDKFSKKTYVPFGTPGTEEYEVGLRIAFVILLKAMFFVMKRHHAVQIYNRALADYVIQFNEFLSKEGIIF